MRLSFFARLTLAEHVSVYVLASLANAILLVPVIELGSKAGFQLDPISTVALYQLLIGVLVVLLLVSGTVGRLWRWQYVASGMLFALYVGVRLGSRFLGGLESIRTLQTQNMYVSSDLQMLYWFGLAAAACFFGMVLAARKAYGKLVVARTAGYG